MSPRALSRWLSVVALAACCTAAAYAQAYGRVVLTVVDPAGDPLPGIEITVQNDKTNYHGEKKTNKKGRAMFTFTDVAGHFVFKVAAEGYVPVEKAVQLAAASTVNEQIQLEVQRTVKAGGGIEAGAGDDAGLVAAFNAGVEALTGGDLATAKSKFQEVLATDEKMALAHSALSSIYLREQDYAAALASIERFLELSPADSRAYRTLYEAHRGLGHDAEAEKALQALTELNEDGDTPAILYNEGMDALRVGDIASARARFEEAIEADPNHVPALTALAKVYSDEKNFAEAAKVAEKLHAQDPDNVTLIRLLYVSYHELGDTENRDRVFKLLAEADPEAMAKQFFDHGVALFNAGRVEEAAGEFERALELNPTIAEGHYRLGMCYVNLGDKDKAREHLTRFITDEPNHADAQLARNMLQLLK